jgi:hypothetical protein
MNWTRLDTGFLVDQYEALRREALALSPEGRRGHGLALFVTRGMVAWISALSALSCRQRPTGDEQPAAAVAVRPEVTTVLANMVLGCLEERAG